ncbi:MAG: 3'(2'),5'-bisphosphate nucleotidase CysQ [Nitrospirota bacterium]
MSLNFEQKTPKKVLLAALHAAKKAGDAILQVYGTNFTIERKEDRTPLTLADKNSHRIISDQLLRNSPEQIPFLSEEGRNIPYAERMNWEYFWLVDPLDGTKEFINRNGEFTVNIALIHNQAPVMGVVHVPVSGTIYYSAEGLGAYKLEKSCELINIRDDLENLVSISKRLPADNRDKTYEDNISRITIIGSRSHMSRETEDYINKIRKKYGEVEFISAGSSLKFCLVAEGMADVYPRFGPTMEWDTAAGQAIVEQAGGVVLSIKDNSPLRYNKENLLNPFFIAGRKGIN